LVDKRDPNSANLFHGRSPMSEISDDLILAQSMPPGGRSLIAPPLSTASCLLLLLSPYQGHGSLRGRRLPPQHPVRSTGAAMSTTGSRGNHAAQRPPSQPACTLALAGNPHIRTAVRMDLVKVWSGARGLWLFRPTERLAGPPDAVQDHRQLAGQRDTRLAGAGPLRDHRRPVLQA